MLKTAHNTLHKLHQTRIGHVVYACLLWAFVFFILSVTVVHAQEASGGNPISAVADFFGQKFKEAADGIWSALGDVVYTIALGIGGIFLGIGGIALDLAIQKLVIGMGDMYAFGGIGTGVIELWRVVRDIFNILFIYSFIYLGIRTILNSDSSSTQRALGYLIVAAVLINFSLFVTQAIVDFSNIAATQIYNQIVHNGLAQAGGGSVETQQFQFSATSISGAFVNVSNITTWLGGTQLTSREDFGFDKVVIYSVFMMIFFIVAGFMFLVAAIRLLARFIALTLYMIFSPMMFLGWILPNFAAHSSKWWGGFIKNAFFAPAFLFLIYISLLLMTRMRDFMLQGGGTDYTAAFKGATMEVGHLTIILFFMMMIGFLYASMKVGDMMAVAGYKSTSKFGHGVLNGMRNNLQGLLYRNTVGLGLDKLGGGLYNRLDKAAEGKGRFHLANITRSVIGGESGRKAVEKAANYGAGGLGRADVEKQNNERSQRAARANAVASIESAIKQFNKQPNNPTVRSNMERLVAKAKSDQILEIAKSDSGKKALLSVAGDLNPEQIKALNADKTLTDTFLSDLASAKQSATANKLNIANNPQDVSKATKDDLKFIGFNVLFNNAEYLQDSQLDDLKAMTSDGTLTPTELNEIKDERKQKINAASATPQNALAIINSRKGEKEIAKLPKEFLEDPNFIIAANLQNSNFKITASLLAKIANESDGVDKRKIGANIRSAFGTNVPPDVAQFLQGALGAMFK